MIILVFAAVWGLIFGSFLNMLAWRLLHNKTIFTSRSYCPICTRIIAWYDNIPVMSYVSLLGRCRHCDTSISYLYPFVELASAGTMMLLARAINPFIYPVSFFAYSIAFGGLLICMRTDLEAMLIPRACTLGMIPVGLLCAALGLLEVSFYNACLGAMVGYGFLFAIATIYRLCTKRVGLGQGDIELVGMIGAFWGVAGAWMAITIGSVLGALIGLMCMLFLKKGRYHYYPMGPLLVLGLFIHFFFW